MNKTSDARRALEAIKRGAGVAAKEHAGNAKVLRAQLLAIEADATDALTVPEREERGWQPIDTAPKDGTVVLITGVGLARWQTVGRWVGGKRRGSWHDDGRGGLRNVDFWMSLPAPPREDKSDE